MGAARNSSVAWSWYNFLTSAEATLVPQVTDARVRNAASYYGDREHLSLPEAIEEYAGALEPEPEEPAIPAGVPGLYGPRP